MNYGEWDLIPTPYIWRKWNMEYIELARLHITIPKELMDNLRRKKMLGNIDSIVTVLLAEEVERMERNGFFDERNKVGGEQR